MSNNEGLNEIFHNSYEEELKEINNEIKRLNEEQKELKRQCDVIKASLYEA